MNMNIYEKPAMEIVVLSSSVDPDYEANVSDSIFG